MVCCVAWHETPLSLSLMRVLTLSWDSRMVCSRWRCPLVASAAVTPVLPLQPTARADHHLLKASLQAGGQGRRTAKMSPDPLLVPCSLELARKAVCWAGDVARR